MFISPVERDAVGISLPAAIDVHMVVRRRVCKLIFQFLLPHSRKIF